ncbi:MAG: DUF4910 domain-containing protein [Alphaproteobacteria bacterium]|nr:DUF4910 domain-containing protein [Alphaproteobacteria bacterium]
MDIVDNQALERMREFISRYWMWNRVPVGDDTARFVRDMADQWDASIISVPSGAECLTWVVPPKWSVREAYIESPDGERIADFAKNPLYLKSYSAPFSGEVDRDTLREHVLSDPQRPDDLIYDYRAQYQYGERTEWGFSLPHRIVDSLPEGNYRAHIDVAFGEGTLDVLDWYLPGGSSETIFFAAHTCHPAQVNDGIACIAVLIELFLRLAQQPKRRFSYRLLLGPEYFAGAAVLAHATGIENLRYGFFLDMMGNGQRFGYSRSYRGDSLVDRIVSHVLQANTDDFFETDYRKLWGNDELFYDGPDYRIPTIGLGRDRFVHYHTDKDDPEHCDYDQLLESVDILSKMVEIFESDVVVARNYRGPLYLSRYGLYIDPKLDPNGYQHMQEIQIEMDGTRSNFEIAERLGVSHEFVTKFAEQLIAHGLAQIVEDRKLDVSN